MLDAVLHDLVTAAITDAVRPLNRAIAEMRAELAAAHREIAEMRAGGIPASGTVTRAAAPKDHDGLDARILGAMPLEGWSKVSAVLRAVPGRTGRKYGALARLESARAIVRRHGWVARTDWHAHQAERAGG